MGDLSPHFSLKEFRCKCPRRHWRTPRPPAELINVLEALRSRTSRPLSIVSGYRCPAHNASIGGAANSQHLRGAAADIPKGRVRVEEAVAAGARGIGHWGGWVVHVDVRPGTPVIFEDRPRG